MGDGADPEVIETRVTHTRKTKSRSAFQGYHRGQQWAVVCAEVAKLRISLRPRGQVRPLLTPLLTAGADRNDEGSQGGDPASLSAACAARAAGDPTGNRNPADGHERPRECANRPGARPASES
jgi:hypothetical protein